MYVAKSDKRKRSDIPPLRFSNRAVKEKDKRGKKYMFDDVIEVGLAVIDDPQLETIWADALGESASTTSGSVKSICKEN